MHSRMYAEVLKETSSRWSHLLLPISKTGKDPAAIACRVAYAVHLSVAPQSHQCLLRTRPVSGTACACYAGEWAPQRIRSSQHPSDPLSCLRSQNRVRTAQHAAASDLSIGPQLLDCLRSQIRSRTAQLHCQTCRMASSSCRADCEDCPEPPVCLEPARLLACSRPEPDRTAREALGRNRVC